MPVSDVSSSKNHLSSLTDNKNGKHKVNFGKSKSFGRDSTVGQSSELFSTEDVEELKYFKVDKNFRWHKEIIQQRQHSKVNGAPGKENTLTEDSNRTNALNKYQGQKRRKTTFRDQAKKIKLVEEAVIGEQQDNGTMYDYRSSSIKTTDTDYIAKNEEDEENMINAFYQQRYLGGSNNSIATLCNIGNSCYLNSVIYTLRFAPYFLHKLHHLCDDMHYVYQKIGQNKLKSSSLGRNVSGLQVCRMSVTQSAVLSELMCFKWQLL